jgi:hypothetical protein
MNQYNIIEYRDSIKAVIFQYKADLRRYKKLAETYAKKRDHQEKLVIECEARLKDLETEIKKRWP